MLEENKALNKSETEEYIKEPKMNYAVYTIISILIFIAVYCGWKFISSNIFRDYIMQTDISSLSTEQLNYLKEYSEIDCDNISEITLERTNNKSKVTILYTNISDKEDFIESSVLFEYGDIISDIRTEFYPYENETIEYVYADNYINIDNPNNNCLVFEFNDNIYAEYHSQEITSEISAIFMNSEKNYSDK